ncbi:trypsin-like peptidase domain-containing protein [Mariniblastus fucicola]|uniref:Thioredoxin n=1 Tax=Mariniblastus fucicola TaxID=980251 RepID=A0A5B9PIA1_9BACT|nr:trypsin-like peptidase domain-containing protein [Mariniblastus fucicola]QEG22353.1 hypothetical protein MFFC18_22330 [Mariniblastus fucicola]
MTTIGNPRTVWQYTPALLLLVLVSFCSTLTAAADEKPMLYFFTSKGCAPCIQVKHVIKQLGTEGYPVTTVDVGERPDWADAFRVTHTPTLALVRSNEVLAWQPRPMRAEELRGWFRTIGYTPTRPAGTLKQSTRTASDDSPRTRPVQTKVSLASNKSVAKSGAAFSTPTMHKGTDRPQNRFEARALNATVRLQVKDETGTSYATGTVIHTHQGESLVMTCGHVFRESGGSGEITAEFGFANGATVKVPGKLLDYDAKANDIALVAIQNGNHSLNAVEVAIADLKVDRGDRVFSVGCDHGDDPTIRNTAIKNLARYDGSMKYDIYGRPVNGRSGGGLFNAQGQLIGVCNAAAVEVDEGIYSALETVHWQITKTNLEHLFQSTPASPLRDRRMIASNAAANAADSRNLVPIRRQRETPRSLAPRTAPRTAPRVAAASSPVQNVSFQSPVRSSDQEVIITVRSKSNPQDSRTITISDPTPKLLDYLGGMEGDESRSLKMAQYREWR